MFAVAFYLQSSVLLTSFLAGVTKHESWIPVVIGALISIPIIYMFRTFMVMFPDKNLLQIFEEVFGKFVGKFLSIAMLWFYLTVSALNVSDLANFVKITFLPETPRLFTTLCCVLLSVWAVRHGFGVVSRYGSLFTIIEFGIVITSLIFLANQMKFSNFLPIFSLPFMKYVQSTHIITVIPISEIMVFLMITPCVRKLEPKQVTKYWFLGAAMGIIVLLAVLMRDIAVLGNALHFFNLPGLVSLRLVNLGEALSRLEILFAVGIMLLLFFKITVLVYASTVALATLFGTVQYKNLALITGVFIVIYSPTLYDSGIEHVTSARAYEAFTNGLFEVVIPFITLVLAKFRNLPKPVKEEAGNEGG